MKDDELDIRLEIARGRLEKGTHEQVEGMYLVCALFYADMVKLINRKTEEGKFINNQSDVYRVLENIRTSSDVMSEYISLNNHDKEKFGRLVAFGMVQCLTQIVDTAKLIYDLVGMDGGLRFKSIKDQDFWKFRNRHSHVKTYAKNRSFGDPEDLDTHIFLSERTNADHIYYYTIGKAGWMGRPASLGRIYADAGREIREVFTEIYKHCEAQ